MPYPELMIRPFREELTRIGFEELKTPEQVDQALSSDDSVMVVVNSVCGCAAGKARPGIAMSLNSQTKPAKLTTVFAGADEAATDRVRRHYLSEFPASSPSIAILKGGKPVYMMHRRDIEGASPEQIAAKLTEAYAEHC
jgi:putative YphP/YqiW family bacilliredoxin